jgi:hypothetical protein
MKKPTTGLITLFCISAALIAPRSGHANPLQSSDIKPYQAESVQPIGQPVNSAAARPLQSESVVVDNLRCTGIQCTIDGSSNVIVTGSKPDLAGARLTLVVIDEAKAPVHREIVQTGRDGSFRAAVSARNLPAGRYKFGLVTANTPPAVIAGGEMSVSIRRGPTGDLSYFFRTFGLAIPGVAYTTDNYATNTRSITVAAGTVTKSAVRINPDGSYIWNSAWDGKVIRGQWKRDNSAIILLNAQGGLNWRMERMPQPQGRAVVTLWDQNSIWYHGTPLP